MLSSTAFRRSSPEGSNSRFSCSAIMISTESKGVKNFHTQGLLIATNQELSNVVRDSLSRAGLDPRQVDHLTLPG